MVAIINNREMKQAFSDAVKSQIVEQPNIADNSKVIPIINITPRNNKIVQIIKYASCINATSTTIYTTPAKGDFYLTAASLDFIKDAGSTSTNSAINSYVNGAQVDILKLRQLSGVASLNAVTQSFDPPIKIDKSTPINLLNFAAVANISSGAIIMGYIEDSL